MSYIAITGRLPELSIAELESLYGAGQITRIGDHVLVDAEVDFARLGGSVKLARYIATIPTTNPQKVFEYCRQHLSELLQDLPEGKIKFGVSLYGIDLPLAKQNAAVLSLKKAIKQTSRSVRAVPNTEQALSSAQTYHNAMTSPVGLELVCVSHDGKTYLGRVTNVQDIDSYTLRDRGRPKRDPFVGMLPPKLAQAIINLAVGRWQLEDGSFSSPIANSHIPHATILDPFCGTGVILQEAMLMGFNIYGTDISEKMVRYSRDNLNWAMDKFHCSVERQFEVGDATSHTWRQPIGAVACEGYLGRPVGGQTLTPEQLSEIIHDCNAIMRGFLQNIHTQVAVGTRFCIAAPAWYVNGTLHHLPVIDDLVALGFERIAFQHVDTHDLVYSREDQVTHRELLVLTRS